MTADLVHQYIAGVIDDAEQRMAKRIGATPSHPGKLAGYVHNQPVYYSERREDYARRERFARIVTGEDRAFWWTLKTPLETRYDAEQELAVFEAVGRAVALPGATPAERWAVVERAIRNLAFDCSEAS